LREKKVTKESMPFSEREAVRVRYFTIRIQCSVSLSVLLPEVLEGSIGMDDLRTVPYDITFY